MHRLFDGAAGDTALAVPTQAQLSLIPCSRLRHDVSFLPSTWSMVLSSSRIIGGVVNMTVVPSAAVDECPHIHHRCIRRADDSTLADYLWAWYLLPLHLISALAFTVIMVSVLDNRNYPVCDNGDSWWRSLLNCGLAQSDVTSLISAALVLIRLVTSAWFTVSAWRGTYILLEKRGMTLAQMSNMVMFHWPGFSNSLGSAYTWLTAAMFLLILPAQLIAPLASGSVSWLPDHSYSVGPDLEIPTAQAGLYWDYFSIYPEHRSRAVLRAAARSSTDLAVDLFNASSQARMLSQRHVNALSGLPADTTIGSITMPYISIDSLEWVEDASAIPGWIPQAVENSDSPVLNFSQGVNPMTRTDPGTAAILKDTSWSPYPTYPQPEVFHGERYVAILVSRTNNVDVCPADSPVFGPVGRISIISQYFPNVAISCFAVAKVSLSVGQTACRNCKMVAPSVVQASSTNESLTVMPDPLIPVILDMLPEVMGFMATMNTTSAPTYNNIDQYLRGTIALAYQASWNSLTDLFSDDGQAHSTTGVRIPNDVIRASVLASRMYAWFALNLLLTAAGLILMWLQRRCNGKTVRDFILAAVLMDPQEILQQDDNGICNAVTISKQDKLLGTLRLVDEPPGTAVWHHRRLVLGGTSVGDDGGLRARRSFYPKGVDQAGEVMESQNTLSQTSSWSAQDTRPLLTQLFRGRPAGAKDDGCNMQNIQREM